MNACFFDHQLLQGRPLVIAFKEAFVGALLPRFTLMLLPGPSEEHSQHLRFAVLQPRSTVGEAAAGKIRVKNSPSVFSLALEEQDSPRQGLPHPSLVQSCGDGQWEPLCWRPDAIRGSSCGNPRHGNTRCRPVRGQLRDEGLVQSLLVELRLAVRLLTSHLQMHERRQAPMTFLH